MRLILGDIRQPVLVVGAGQGLIVEELRRQGLRCDGIDLSARMMEYARVRRGLTLVRANATAMPFADGAYETAPAGRHVARAVGTGDASPRLRRAGVAAASPPALGGCRSSGT